MEAITTLIIGKDSSDTCVKHLDEWIEPIKKKVYEKHFKGPNNAPVVLNNFIGELSRLNIQVCFALREQNVNTRDATLKGLGWPDELIACTKHTNVRTDVTDRLELWCKTYTLNSEHLTTQKINNELS